MSDLKPVIKSGLEEAELLAAFDTTTNSSSHLGRFAFSPDIDAAVEASLPLGKPHDVSPARPAIES